MILFTSLLGEGRSSLVLMPPWRRSVGLGEEHGFIITFPSFPIIIGALWARRTIARPGDLISPVRVSWGWLEGRGALLFSGRDLVRRRLCRIDGFVYPASESIRQKRIPW